MLINLNQLKAATAKTNQAQSDNTDAICGHGQFSTKKLPRKSMT